MKLRTVPAREGVRWVREGFRVFAKRPLAFAALFATFVFAVFVLLLLPFIGAIVVLVLLPLFSLGFMIATRIALDGGAPNARVFVDPLRGDPARRNALLQLGIVYAAAAFLVMWLADSVDGGALESLMESMPAGQAAPDAMAARLAAPGFGLGMLVRFGLAGLLAVPLWHAPALVHWDGHGCAKSLFASTLACWRNRGAFTLYSLAWLGLIVACSLASGLLFALLGQPQLMMVAAVPLSLLFTTVFYISLYFTFADCFAAADGDTADGALLTRTENTP
ncbi:MAG TPA: BPSS1780 family membrane protein [Burkholderiaceae bacterium]|nr:BPSS1780 family membrane protein [Burkholderiaceae bacterium]